MLLILTSTGHGLFSFINIDDLEPTRKKGFLANFRNFWLQRTFQEWIAMKWLESGDKPRQPTYKIFSIKR